MVVEWQPIETAPRDGTKMLLFADGAGVGDEIEIGWWIEDSDADGGGTWRDDGAPSTHWMPLPEPPHE